MLKISVIIPIYNREKFITETLKSVENQLLQPSEVILVDDNSTDNSVKVLEAFAKESKLPITILQNERKKGQSGATNYGIEKASGNFIALLDSDDLWTPMHLQQLFSALNTFPQAQIAFSEIELFGDAKDVLNTGKLFNIAVSRCLNLAFTPVEKDVWLSNENLLRVLMRWGCPFRCPASLIKRNFFLKHHLYFDEDLTYTLDSQFMTMSAYFTPFLYVNKIGALIRRHYENDGDLSYGTKIIESYDKRVTNLKLFFKDKKINSQEKRSLKYLLWGLQNAVMESRSKGKGLKTSIFESFRLLYKVPSWLSIKSFIKNIIINS